MIKLFSYSVIQLFSYSIIQLFTDRWISDKKRQTEYALHVFFYLLIIFRLMSNKTLT
jgi:ABC-type bacteriocin/lantibiotic exporter with double-glycine peptidase domain